MSSDPRWSESAIRAAFAAVYGDEVHETLLIEELERQGAARAAGRGEPPAETWPYRPGHQYAHDAAWPATSGPNPERCVHYLGNDEWCHQPEDHPAHQFTDPAAKCTWGNEVVDCGRTEPCEQKICGLRVIPAERPPATHPFVDHGDGDYCERDGCDELWTHEIHAPAERYPILDGPHVFQEYGSTDHCGWIRRHGGPGVGPTRCNERADHEVHAPAGPAHELHGSTHSDRETSPAGTSHVDAEEADIHPQGEAARPGAHAPAAPATHHEFRPGASIYSCGVLVGGRYCERHRLGIAHAEDETPAGRSGDEGSPTRTDSSAEDRDAPCRSQAVGEPAPQIVECCNYPERSCEFPACEQRHMNDCFPLFDGSGPEGYRSPTCWTCGSDVPETETP